MFFEPKKVDTYLKKGRLTEAIIRSKLGGACKISYGDKTLTLIVGARKTLSREPTNVKYFVKSRKFCKYELNLLEEAQNYFQHGELENSEYWSKRCS